MNAISGIKYTTQGSYVTAFYTLDPTILVQAATSPSFLEQSDLMLYGKPIVLMPEAKRKAKLSKLAPSFSTAFATVANPLDLDEEDLVERLQSSIVLPMILYLFTSKEVLTFILRLLIRAAIEIIRNYESD